MVNVPPRSARVRVVTLGAIILVACGLGSPGAKARAAGPGTADPKVQVRTALGRGSFPWYDPQADRVRPLKLPRPPKPPDLKPPTGLELLRGGWAWGDYLVFGGFVAALIALVVLVIRYWERFEPTAAATTAAARHPEAIRSGEVLPAGLRGAGVTDDPWAEANRLRLAGDLAGAIVCLFAHQLLILSKRGHVRLAPGRTGRQLHRAVADAEFQTLMSPTLRQFEAVYYGHRTPTAADFAAVWTAAEAFERRAAAEVAS